MTNESVSKFEWLAGLRGADLTHAEFRVLVALFTYTDATLSNAYPSKATLAESARVTPRTLTASLRTLQKKGFARIVKAGGNQYGKGAANVWELLPHNNAKGITQGPPSQQSKGVPDVPPSQGEGGPSVPVKGVPEYRSRGPLSDPPSGHRSGHGSGKVRADPSATTEGVSAPPPRYCPNHPGGTDTPCRGCASARETHQAWQRQQTHAERTAKAAAAQADADTRRAAIAACPMCDPAGYRFGRVCNHNPNQDDTNRRGIELVRAALAGRTTP